MPRFSLDFKVVLPVGFLLVLGLLLLKSISPQLWSDQVIFSIVAVFIFILFSQIDYRILFSLYFPLFILSMLFLISPLFFGLYSRGSQRWLFLGPFSLQPSELVKPVLMLFFAVVAASEWDNKLRWLLLLGIIPLIAIFIQPDLGTTLIVGVGWLTIFSSQVSFKKLVSVYGVMIIMALPIYHFALRDYQRQRITSFINPNADPLGQGYHVIQSTIAVGSGQLSGRGLGQGTQSQLRFLPEHHTDFIFASLSEELGLVGSVFVLALFSVILWRLYHISQTSSSLSASLFCLASMSMLCFQIFINIGMNLGLAPVTGITLPFISYGGSSLLSLGILLGVASSISQNAVSRV